MRYLLLIANSAERLDLWETLDAEAQREWVEAETPKWNALFERMGRSGNPVAALQLDLPRKARTLRNGSDLVTDGPYAETKEQIGGFLLVDCESLDDAIELAAEVPAATTGSVEIRPLAD